MRYSEINVQLLEYALMMNPLAASTPPAMTVILGCRDFSREVVRMPWMRRKRTWVYTMVRGFSQRFVGLRNGLWVYVMVRGFSQWFVGFCKCFVGLRIGSRVVVFFILFYLFIYFNYFFAVGTKYSALYFIFSKPY